VISQPIVSETLQRLLSVLVVQPVFGVWCVCVSVCVCVCVWCLDYVLPLRYMVTGTRKTKWNVLKCTAASRSTSVPK
jgi:hypothetical protein